MATTTGINKFKLRLRKKETEAITKLRRGLMLGGLFLQAESQKIVPKDKGNLHGSAFTRRDMGAPRLKPAVIVGYTAAYAIYVHEIPDPPVAHGWAYNLKHRWEISTAHTAAQKRRWHERGQNQQYKFLETPAREKRKQIIQVIRSVF